MLYLHDPYNLTGSLHMSSFNRGHILSHSRVETQYRCVPNLNAV